MQLAIGRKRRRFLDLLSRNRIQALAADPDIGETISAAGERIVAEIRGDRDRPFERLGGHRLPETRSVAAIAVGTARSRTMRRARFDDVEIVPWTER